MLAFLGETVIRKDLGDFLDCLFEMNLSLRHFSQVISYVLMGKSHNK